jgi:predicted Zn-ribbon and HTH transcriptional regulator
MSRYIDADKGLRSKIQLETGCNFDTADRIVESRPTADVKHVVHGKWEKNEHTFLTCNKCGFVNKYNRMQYAYCPNCGAEMRGEE